MRLSQAEEFASVNQSESTAYDQKTDVTTETTDDKNETNDNNTDSISSLTTESSVNPNMTCEEFEAKYVSRFTKDKYANRKIVDEAAKELGFDTLPELDRLVNKQIMYEDCDKITAELNENNSTNYTQAFTDFLAKMYDMIKTSIKNASKAASDIFSPSAISSNSLSRKRGTNNAKPTLPDNWSVGENGVIYNEDQFGGDGSFQ